MRHLLLPYSPPVPPRQLPSLLQNFLRRRKRRTRELLSLRLQLAREHANLVLHHSFVYLGIPQAVFDYRPKMPGPKMATFWAVTIGLTGAYIYDRRECERLQKEYIDQVKWMSEAPLDSMDMSRRVKVLGARVPEDGEVDRSSKWFKRYMRVSVCRRASRACEPSGRLQIGAPG